MRAGSASVAYDLIKNKDGRIIERLVKQNYLGNNRDLSQWTAVFGEATIRGRHTHNRCHERDVCDKYHNGI